MQSNSGPPHSAPNYAPQAVSQNGVYYPGNIAHSKDPIQHQHQQQPMTYSSHPQSQYNYSNAQMNPTHFPSPVPLYQPAHPSTETTSMSVNAPSQFSSPLPLAAVPPNLPNTSFQYPVSSTYNSANQNTSQHLNAAASSVPSNCLSAPSSSHPWVPSPHNPPPSVNSLHAPLEAMHLNGSGAPQQQQQLHYSANFPSQPQPFVNQLPSVCGPAALAVNLLQDQVNSSALSWELEHTHADYKPDQLIDVHGQVLRETPANAVCCTLGGIPRTSALSTKCRLPLGLHIQPLAVLSADSLAVVQPRDIIRCQRCRSYINPFVRWIYGYGTAANDQWECSVCLSVNRTSGPLESDLMISALRFASIDYAAPVDYVQAPPKPPVYTFIFDVSRDALVSGYLSLVCSRLLSILRNQSYSQSGAGGVPLPGDRRTRVAILTYDAAVHFYRLDEEGPRMFVCPDLEEPYVPCSQGLLCNLASCNKNLEYLLEQLPIRWNVQPNVDPASTDSSRKGNALGAVFQAALLLLQGTGGRVFVFNSTLPNKEPGSLAHREDIGVVKTARATQEKIDQAVGPATDFYKRMALELSTKNITVSLFAPGNQFMDLATISALSRYTGGKLYHYPAFRLQLRSIQEWTQIFENEKCALLCREMTGLASAHRLWQDLGDHLTNTNVALEAVMRVRCPKEVTIRSFFGNTFVRSVDLISLPTVHEDSAFSVHMDLQQEIPMSVNFVCFQVALLYSSVWGERRLRVHTLRVPVVDHPETVFQNANGNAIVGMLTRFACSRSLVDIQMSKAREALVSALQDIFRAYGDECASGGGMQRTDALWAPPSLQHLALYMNGLLRSKALRVFPPTPLDVRVCSLSFFFSTPVLNMLLEMYPQLYRVHVSQSEGAIQNQICRLSTNFLDRDGVFVLLTAVVCYILVRRGISSDVIRDLFGVNSFTELQEFASFTLSTRHGEDNHRHSEFVNFLNNVNVLQCPIVVVRDDGILKDDILLYLIDHQKAESSLSYPEFLRYLRSGFRYKGESK